MEPIARLSARVLPVCPEGEVLLLQDQDPTDPDVQRWGTIGGALEPGETPEQAAVRELHEETGLRADPAALTPAFFKGSYEMSLGGIRYRDDSTWFAMPLSRDVEVTLEQLAPGEISSMVSWGWWSPEALASDGSAVGPDLPDLMAAAVDAVRRGIA